MDTTDLDKSPDPQAKVVQRGKAGPVGAGEDAGAATVNHPFDPASGTGGGFAGGTNDAAQRQSPDPSAPGSTPGGQPSASASHADRMFDHDDEDGQGQSGFRKRYGHVRLNRDQPYGVIAGDGADGAHFAQDGLYFDNEGYLVESDFLHPKETLAALDKRGKSQWARQKADAYYESLMNDDPRTAPGTLRVEQQVEPTPAKFDLAAWARGERGDVPFSVARAAAQEQFGFAPGNTRALVGLLIDKGIIKREDLRVG